MMYLWRIEGRQGFCVSFNNDNIYISSVYACIDVHIYYNVIILYSLVKLNLKK